MSDEQPTLDELLAQLASTNQDARCAAARALGARGDPAAVPALCAALRDADHALVWEVAEALGRLGDPAAVPALVAAYDPALYQAIVPALRRLDGPAARAALVAMAHDPDRVLKRAALSALVDLGAHEALPAALEAARGATPELLVAFTAIEQLAQPPNLPAVRAALLDALRASLDADVRAAVRRCLAALARHEPALVTSLLGDPDWLARRTAALALGDVGGDAVIRPLLQALADPDPMVRWGAGQALARLRNSAAVAALAAVQDDPDPLVRRAAEEAK